MLKNRQNLERKVTEIPSPDYLNQYAEVKSELEDFNAREARAAIIRARADFIEHDEKNAKYFLAKEKFIYSAQCIKCLKTTSGQICDETMILEEEKQFIKTDTVKRKTKTVVKHF